MYVIFNETLKKEFPNFKLFKSDSKSDLQCNICSEQFSIQGGGRYDITKHISSEKHKKYVDSASSSSKVSDYYRYYEFSDQEKYLAVKEGVFAYHNIMHCHSFRSMDCTSKIIKKCFEKKFALGRTKCEAIITKVFFALVKNQLKEDLDKCNYITVFSDTSNHKDIKLFYNFNTIFSL